MAKEKKALANEEADIHRKLVNQVNVNEHLYEKKQELSENCQDLESELLGHRRHLEGLQKTEGKL